MKLLVVEAFGCLFVVCLSLSLSLTLAQNVRACNSFSESLDCVPCVITLPSHDVKGFFSPGLAVGIKVIVELTSVNFKVTLIVIVEVVHPFF